MQESGKVVDGSNADLCTDFWNQMERDLNWVVELGANAFRFSLAWERLEPQKGVFDESAFLKYENLLQKCKQFGVEPIVTLLHFVLPGWLADEGGLTSHEFAERFENYVAKVAQRLGHELKIVITINEPMVQVSFGYLNGIWPPGKMAQYKQASVAAAALAMAHARAYVVLKKYVPGSMVSISKHWRLFDPRCSISFMDRGLAGVADRFFNKNFLSFLLERRANFSPIKAKYGYAEFPGHGPLIDFLGINYYGRMMVGLSFSPPFITIQENPKAPFKSDLGWEIYPKGLKRILLKWKSLAPHIPIMITENGVADANDRLRASFIKDHVEELIQSSKELGIKVLGYIHWSLTDNFEWSEGLEPRFGLIKVNYSDHQNTKMTFEKRKSFNEYQDLIKKYSDMI